MKLKLNVVLFLLGFVLISAQKTFRVSGIIKDFHNSSPLKGAEIKIGKLSSISDENGHFNFSTVPAGVFTLVASHHDCETLTEEVSINRDVFLTLSLEHHAEEIEAVHISGTRRPSRTVSVQTLDKALLQRNSTQNLGNLLSSISGVASLKTGNNISKPVIHGLYGSRISIINNGVKMAEQEWGVEHAPSIEPSSFERINVVKGSGALKYSGDAVGGVVVLNPQVFPAKDSIMGNFSLSGISNGKGLKAAATLVKIWEDRWFVKSGGTYQKLGDLSIPKHTLQNTGAQENSMNVSFGNRDFKQGFEAGYSIISQDFGIFKGSHLGGPEDFYNAVNNEGSSVYYDNFSYKIENPKQEVRHHIAKLEAYRRFYNIGKLSFRYSFQLNSRKEFDIRRGELNELPSLDLRLITHNAQLEHLIEREDWQLESGVHGLFQDNFPNPATQARRLIPDYYRYDAGVFSVFQYRLSPKIKTEVGARYDFSKYDAYKYYDQSDWQNRFAHLFPHFEVSKSGSRVLTRPVMDFHNFSVNAGIGFTPWENTDIKINFSKASRTPNPAELFADGLHHSAAIIEKGELSIKKEEVYHVNLSLKTKIDFLEGFQFEVNPYMMFSDSFVNQLPIGTQNSNRGVFMIWAYQQTKARIFGIDADLQLDFSKNFKWNSQLSALKGDDLQNNEPLILMMPPNFKNSLEFNLQNPSGFFLKLENETFSTQKRFPVRNVNLDLIENGNIVTKTLDTSTPPKGYSVFHVSAGVDLVRNFNVNFRINNIFNTEYRDYLNRLRFFAPELGRSLILTFKYSF